MTSVYRAVNAGKYALSTVYTKEISYADPILSENFWLNFPLLAYLAVEVYGFGLGIEKLQLKTSLLKSLSENIC